MTLKQQQTMCRLQQTRYDFFLVMSYIMKNEMKNRLI